MKLDTKGFTLIELLVVVLIIGILAAVAVPQYNKAVEKSRAAEALTTLVALSKAVNVYVLANGFSKVDLLGKASPGFSDATQSLDIGMNQNIDCATDDYCHSKNFRYDGSCTDNECNLYAYRQENGDTTKPQSYMLRFRLVANSSGQWRRTCDGYTNIGKSTCNALKSQGFN